MQTARNLSVPATVVCVRPLCRQHRSSNSALLGQTPEKWRVCGRLAAQKGEDKPKISNRVDTSNWEGIIGTVGTVAAYAALVYYAVALSPNQTPLRDGYFLEKLVGLGVDDGVPINQVLYSVFNLMGIYPMLYASLMVPAARSGNKVPVWPFIVGSFGFGVFALFPYLCLWQPRTDDTAPPSAEELESGWGRFGLQATESLWFPATLLLGAGGLLANVASAGIPAINRYIQYFDESRFIHVMTVDFFALTALMPFFLYWDAEKRKWGPRDIGVPVLSLLPLVGPAVYLMLRPKASKPSE